MKQLLSPSRQNGETSSAGTNTSSRAEGGDSKLNVEAANAASGIKGAVAGDLLSQLAVLQLLVRRAAFWHLTFAKGLMLCAAIGSFAWMPTFYVRRGNLNIEQV